MRAAAIPVLLLSCLAACDHEEPAGGYIIYPSSTAPGAQAIVRGGGPGTHAARDSARIMVLPDKRADRPAEVLGVVDAHVGQGDEDAALAILRGKAAALGADAVIGVDLHHGEGHRDEPIHLSGLAIRYLERPVARFE